MCVEGSDQGGDRFDEEEECGIECGELEGRRHIGRLGVYLQGLMCGFIAVKNPYQTVVLLWNLGVYSCLPLKDLHKFRIDEEV